MNYFSDTDQFIAKWDYGQAFSSESDFCSAELGAPAFTPHDKPFIGALEPGVRTLVTGIIGITDCITYSSCEGHPSNLERPAVPMHVGILPRDQLEYKDLLERLNEAASRMPSCSLPRPTIVETELISGERTRSCIDVIFAFITELDETTYFERLPDAITTFLALIPSTPGKRRQKVLNVFRNRFFELLHMVTHQDFFNASPYPHLYFDDLLTANERMQLADDLCRSVWQRFERSNYSHDAADLTDSSDQQPAAQGLIECLSGALVLKRLSEITGLPRLRLDALNAHLMRPGDAVGPHNDAEGHPTACRLVIFGGNRTFEGGEHLLLTELSDHFHITKRIVYRPGAGILFRMGGGSYHAVTRVEGGGGCRLALVATFKDVS